MLWPSCCEREAMVAMGAGVFVDIGLAPVYALCNAEDCKAWLERVVVVCGLLDANDHGIGADEVLDAGAGEAGFFHPGRAVGAGVVEAAGGFDEHVETHEEAED